MLSSNYFKKVVRCHWILILCHCIASWVFITTFKTHLNRFRFIPISASQRNISMYFQNGRITKIFYRQHIVLFVKVLAWMPVNRARVKYLPVGKCCILILSFFRQEIALTNRLNRTVCLSTFLILASTDMQHRSSFNGILYSLYIAVSLFYAIWRLKFLDWLHWIDISNKRRDEKYFAFGIICTKE